MKWIKRLLMLIALTCTGEAWAQQCTVSSVAVSFGGYDRTAAAPLNATGSIRVACTPATSTVVKLDPGRNSDNSFNTRKMMLRIGEYLNYNLYTDAACTQIWGDGTDSTFTRAGGDNLVVYGRIPPKQNLKSGVYTDSVSIIVEW